MTDEVRPQGLVAYMRVSTDDQRERATIETQRVEIEKYAAKREWELAAWYADDGVSGNEYALGQRPEGARLLAATRASTINAAIVYRVDRLGRGVKGAVSVDELKTAGVRYIISVKEDAYDLRNPADSSKLLQLMTDGSKESAAFRERSMDATNRLAGEGAWLGGIVPYGYHVEGQKRTARLVPSDQDELVPGLTEAEVIRRMYRRTVEDNWSCQRIADELNALGVPPAYVRDGRTPLLRGKRAASTQGIWRPGRIRNMIVNEIYKGVHHYGKRSPDAERQVIERAVPAIVDTDQWEKAQHVLRSHMLFSRRHAKHDYLLRGLIKCGLCGLTYTGMTWDLADGPHTYYRCNGAAQARGLYGKDGHKCPSATAPGEWLELFVWAHVQAFAHNPGAALEELAEKMQAQGNRADTLRDELAGHKLRLASKQQERDTVVSLFRRGRIDDAALDRQLDDIANEEKGLRDIIAEYEAALTDTRLAEENLQSADALLRELQTSVDTALDFETRRRVIERLVERIIVDTTTDEQGSKVGIVTVYYYFGDPNKGGPPHSIATRTDTRADNKSRHFGECTLARTYGV